MADKTTEALEYLGEQARRWQAIEAVLAQMIGHDVQVIISDDYRVGANAWEFACGEHQLAVLIWDGRIVLSLEAGGDAVVTIDGVTYANEAIPDHLLRRVIEGGPGVSIEHTPWFEILQGEVRGEEWCFYNATGNVLYQLPPIPDLLDLMVRVAVRLSK